MPLNNLLTYSVQLLLSPCFSTELPQVYTFTVNQPMENFVMVCMRDLSSLAGAPGIYINNDS